MGSCYNLPNSLIKYAQGHLTRESHMDQDTASTSESKAHPTHDSAARPKSKALEIAALALGALAILVGAGCNAWTLPALIGESSTSLVIFAWVLDVALVMIGFLVIRRRELIARLLIPVGASLLLFCGCLSLLDVYVGYRFLVTADRDVAVENVHVPDPHLGWRLKAGSTGTHRTPEYDVQYTIDERGFRAVPHEGTPARSVYFFGDSYAFGHGVPNEQTFPNVIQREYVAKDVHVYNAGVMGYGLVQMYARFLELEAEIGPGDLVVLAPTSADIRRNMADFMFPAQFIFRDKVIKVERYPYLDAEGNVQAAELDTPYNRAKALLFFSRFAGRPFHLLYKRTIPDTTEQALDIVARMRSRTEGRGAQFALVFLPTTHESLKRAYDVDISRFDYTDIMAAFPSDEKGIAEITLGEIDTHWNRAGHEIAARAILESLVAHGKLDSESLQ